MTFIIEEILKIQHHGPAQLMGFGIPFAKGVVSSTDNLEFTLNDQSLPLTAQVRSRWPDGSLRWCWCQAVVTQSGTLSVRERDTNNTPQPFAADNTFEKPAARLTLISHNTSTLVSTPEPSITEAPLGTPKHKTASAPLFVIGIEKGQSPKDSFSKQLVIESFLNVGQTPVSSKKSCLTKHSSGLIQQQSLTGCYQIGHKTLNYQADLILCESSGQMNLSFRIHNPQPAQHIDGSWDLGDSGSLNIERLGLVFELAGSQSGIFIKEGMNDPADKHLTPSPVKLHQGNYLLSQHGSGGSAWQSPIHWNAEKQNTLKARGFTLKETQGREHIEGMRAEPIGLLSFDEKNLADWLTIRPEYFWQVFPCHLESKPGQLQFTLFSEPTELQGGESKTWRFSARIGATNPIDDHAQAEKNIYEKSLNAINYQYNQLYLDHCGVLPHISLQSIDSVLGQLIQEGLSGSHNFFQKREQIDVFGWRHFGELHADHETALSKTPESFVSHYNNQYDPIMGTTLQFVIQKNPHWLLLSQPLTQHVIDIDIYDTEGDKAEYNGGLFWHTDHYLPALTSTHRSYSKYHTAAYEGYAGGGGPGGQHCYTTGLMLQYWLFGNEQAKNKVHQLCQWVSHFYNGSGSLLDRTFRLITIDFKRDQLTNIGVKKPGFRYPLDRGTGNYITAMMDSIEISSQWTRLKEVGRIIQQTVHPNEDLSERQLLDAENAWFYTVFLQAVGRYLFLKESLEQIDDDYWYARHCFMHFLEWMLSHERFYLDQPEQLEFPNDTWVAQEMRKCNLFFYGWYFAKDANPNYLNRALDFFHYIEDKLNTSKEKHYTRILAILMQNAGVREKFQSSPRSKIAWQTANYDPQPPSYSPWLIVKDFLKDLGQLAKSFSVKREIHWLKIRLGKL